MALPKHHRGPDDIIAALARRISSLEAGRAAGAIASPVTSTSMPANPVTGMVIYITDLGLYAFWSGASWVYPPQVITKRTLTASTSAVTLNAIPQVFSHLRLVISAKSDGTTTSGYDAANMQFNGLTAGYNWNSLWVPWAAASSTAGTSNQSSMQFAEIWNNHYTTAGRGIVTVDIPNYSDVNNVKSFTSFASATDGGVAGIMQEYTGSLVNQTASVGSISMLMSVGNFLPDSTFTLYGM